MLAFQLNFVLKAYLMDLLRLSLETSLKRNVYHFLVDHSTVDKSDILNIHKYLMVMNNIK